MRSHVEDKPHPINEDQENLFQFLRVNQHLISNEEVQNLQK